MSAEKLVLATNAYSILIPELRHKQMPGWRERNGIEDARNLIHYYRISPDDRLVMGGGPAGLGYGTDLARDVDPSAWRHLE